MDERDERIARLEALVERQASVARPSSGVAVGTLKVLATLAAVVVGGLILIVLIGNALPDQKAKVPYAEQVRTACQEQAGHLGEAEVNDCQIQILSGELYRQRSEAQRAAAREAGRP